MISLGLVETTICRSFFPLLLFFGIILPIGTTGLASGILMSAITPIIGDQRAVLVSGFLQASAGVGDALMAPGMERLILAGFATCGFNMSIIESHLFSQYLSYGIPGNISSLTLTVYGITTMLGAILTGYLGTKFKMKNVLGTVYAIRVIISLGFLILPKSVPLPVPL